MIYIAIFDRIVAESRKARIGDIMEIKQCKIYPIIKRQGYISPTKSPVISLIGDLEILLEIPSNEEKEILVTQEMLTDKDDAISLYHRACEDLVADVQFVVANTLFGGFAVLADKKHESSAICFQSIWTTCADKLADDLLIMVPARDIVLFAPKSGERVIEAMITQGESNYHTSSHKISREIFMFNRNKRELEFFGK